MGVPQNAGPRTNASGLFVALAFVAGLAMLGLAAVAILGFFAFTVRTVEMAPPAGPVVVENFALAPAEEIPSDSPAVIEIDRAGQTLLGGESLPLETIEMRLRDAMQGAALDSAQVEIRHAEDCPPERRESVLAMLRRLNVENPRITTIPPIREVVVEFDAQGRATVDGQLAEDLGVALGKIADRNEDFATVVFRVHPGCPADVLTRATQMCGKLGLGTVRVEGVSHAEGGH